MTTLDAPAPPREDPHSTPEAVRRLRRARVLDRVAARAIAIGGVLVLAAVVLIFVFVGAEAAPLLRGARLDLRATIDAPAPPLAVGSDEYRSFVACVTREGELALLDPATGAVRVRERVAPEGLGVAAACTPGPDGPVFAVAGADGKLRLAFARGQVTFDASHRRVVTPTAEVGDALDVRDDGPLDRVAFQLLEGEKVFAAVAGPRWISLVRTKTDGGRVRVDRLDEPRLWEAGTQLASLSVALITDSVRVYAGLSDGRVVRWDADWSEEPRLHEAIEVSSAPVTSLTEVLGGETLVCGTGDGAVSTWFGVRASPSAANWDLTRIRTFDPLAGRVALSAPTSRSKSFAVFADDGGGRVLQATTGAVRVEIPPSGAAPTAAAFSPKNDGLVVADARGGIRVFDFEDPHPEASVGALFGKVWYEGGTAPEFKWQSTGGTDDAEPKLSLTTLVFGTLKGVAFALLFSVPVALLAAVYTALFLPARAKAVIKPTLEIMAALPSVVVGLLAALWLSPLAERHLATVFTLPPAFLATFVVVATGWAFLPRHVRTRMTETAAILAVCVVTVLAATALAAAAAPAVERVCFGGDVKAWLRDALGLRYDPRNAMVVGFAMGFAVIPVVFTIAEDAIHNVPKSLWAASEALGASRWQTTMRVVLPAATPGLFAALMLGFGRAVGETMIVLMAAGNTPILDLSPFNGMRTISACIAVEIPEAPHGGTLYRILFLAGALLFVFTFLCNTLAEVVATRLRRRYGRAG